MPALALLRSPCPVPHSPALPEHLQGSCCPISQMRKQASEAKRFLEAPDWVDGRAGTRSQAASSHAPRIHMYECKYSLSTQLRQLPAFGEIPVLQLSGPHKWAWGMETSDSFICGLGPGSLIPTLPLIPHFRVGHRARVKGHGPGGRWGLGMPRGLGRTP